MLKLEIQADNYGELKQKAFEALGLTEPAQGTFNFSKTPPGTALHVHGDNVEPSSSFGGEPVHIESPIANPAMAQAAAPKKTRATKTAPKLPGKVDGELAAAGEQYVKSPKSEEVSQASTAEDPAPGREPAREATHVEAREKLREVITSKGMDTAISLLKKHGVEGIPSLPLTSIEQFINECETVLNA